MAWQMFRVTYELHSPLHIGYHKVGNVQRTRYYIPARNLWGAVTERLTRSGFPGAGASPGDYQKMGEWVKEHCAFTYFFLSDGAHILYPHWGEEGLYYGPFSTPEFERRWLSAHVTTALDASTTSAETGSLHEVEFIAPYPMCDAKEIRRTRLYGWVFLDEVARQKLGDREKWAKWLGELQVGGERRYGFGRLRLSDDGWIAAQEMLPKYEVHLSGKRPWITVGTSQPVLAHTPVDGVQAKGGIEPFVGRETDPEQSHSFGRKLTKGVICWVPGSVLQESTCFEITPEGLWKKV